MYHHSIFMEGANKDNHVRIIVILKHGILFIYFDSSVLWFSGYYCYLSSCIYVLFH